MPRAPLLVVVALLAACQPPPEVGGSGDPSIEIVYPPDDIGSIELQPDGKLVIVIAVDLDGIEFVSPSVSEGNVVEGQGHYHFHVNGEYLGPPEQQLHIYESEVGEFPVDTAMQVRVSLATNNHVDLDEFDAWEDIVEFTVAAAAVPE